MPKLAEALGVSPEPAPWEPKVYDQVEFISYGEGGKASLREVMQVNPSSDGWSPRRGSGRRRF